MLSVLIPTYNYDCSVLLLALSRQAEELREDPDIRDFGCEIIVGDDASTDKAAESTNRLAAQNAGARYVRSAENRGRSATRNALAEQAAGDYLLFMDCDARICTDTFLRDYWNDRDKADVVCGALRNPAGPPPVGHELRYRYEKAAEWHRTAAYRNAHPYEMFTTFNVMFRREAFFRIRFDERCHEYGYEDALMGLMLERNGFSVLHTGNPLIHDGIDSNISFLDKIEASLRTLRRLEGCMQESAGASRAVALLQRLHLCSVTARLFRTFRKALHRQLSGRKPSLFLLKLYKTGYYANLCCGISAARRP